MSQVTRLRTSCDPAFVPFIIRSLGIGGWGKLAVGGQVEVKSLVQWAFTTTWFDGARYIPCTWAFAIGW